MAGTPANQPVTYNLDAGEYVQISQNTELMGSMLEATQPIAFFAAASCLNVPVSLVAYHAHGPSLLIAQPMIMTAVSQHHPAVGESATANRRRRIGNLHGNGCPPGRCRRAASKMEASPDSRNAPKWTKASLLAEVQVGLRSRRRGELWTCGTSAPSYGSHRMPRQDFCGLFEELPDHRVKRTRKHNLATCAVTLEGNHRSR